MCERGMGFLGWRRTAPAECEDYCYGEMVTKCVLVAEVYCSRDE